MIFLSISWVRHTHALDIPHVGCFSRSGYPSRLANCPLVSEPCQKTHLCWENRLWQLQICISSGAFDLLIHRCSANSIMFWCKIRFQQKKSHQIYIPIGSMGRLYISLHGSCGIYIILYFFGVFSWFSHGPENDPPWSVRQLVVASFDDDMHVRYQSHVGLALKKQSLEILEKLVLKGMVFCRKGGETLMEALKKWQDKTPSKYQENNQWNKIFCCFGVDSVWQLTNKNRWTTCFCAIFPAWFFKEKQDLIGMIIIFLKGLRLKIIS